MNPDYFCIYVLHIVWGPYMDTTARTAGGYKEKQLQTDWKGCFGEGRTDKVCERKFVVQPVMDK